MNRVTTPFLFVNPKSYIWGTESLKLAKICDNICRETGIMIFFTCSYVDLRLIAQNTNHIIVTAQNMDSLMPGRGMGAVLPEALADAGAQAVMLNHAENPKTLAELYACINRARDLNMISVACANSTQESKIVAELDPDIVLAEPTALIGTGTTTDVNYILNCCKEIKQVNSHSKIMIASGITTGDDVYKVIFYGADGSGATSGILNAPSRAARINEMATAMIQAMKDRNF